MQSSECKKLRVPEEFQLSGDEIIASKVTNLGKISYFQNSVEGLSLHRG